MRKVGRLRLQSLRLRFRSIGFKLFLVFLVSIVTGCAVSGWLVYSISASALKQKVGNNAVQVTTDAAKQVDLWDRQMEGFFNSTVVFATNNSELTDKRRNVLPTTDADLAEYTKDLAKIDDIQKQIDAETAKLKPNDAKPTILYTLQTQHDDLVKRTQELNKQKTDNDKAMHDYLQSVTLTNGDMLAGAALIRFNGEDSYFSATSLKPKEKPYELDWAKQAVAAKGKTVYFPPQTGSFLFDNSKDRLFAFAKAFWSGEDRVWSDVIIVECKLSYLEDMLRPITFGGIGEVHLLAEDGTTIYSNRSGAAIGQPALVPPPKTDKVFQVVKDGSGTPYDAVGVKLSNQQWELVGAIPQDKLLSDAKKIQQRLYLMLGGAVLAALLLGYWGYATIGRPMLAAERKMRQAELGDLSVRLQFKRGDEIGSVGRSFDQMMERISMIVVNTGASAGQLLDSTDRIKELVGLNESASKEIATAMDEVAKGAADLAGDAERSNVLTGRLQHSLEDVLQKNTVMEKASQQMEATSRDGLATMEELAGQSREAGSKIGELQQKIQQLKASTNSISVVLDWLQDISKKINILSLNASIVAASSGEAGKGFMVVANEIRNLAAQSQQSINSVSEIIERIHADMQVTDELVEQSIPIFERQLSSSEDTQHVFRKISESMQQFSDRFHEVWDSLTASMEAGRELNAVLVQVSAVSEEFTASTEDVANLVSKQYASSNQLVETGKELELLSGKLKESLAGFQLQQEALSTDAELEAAMEEAQGTETSDGLGIEANEGDAEDKQSA